MGALAVMAAFVPRPYWNFLSGTYLDTCTDDVLRPPAFPSPSVFLLHAENAAWKGSPSISPFSPPAFEVPSRGWVGYILRPAPPRHIVPASNPFRSAVHVLGLSPDDVQMAVRHSGLRKHRTFGGTDGEVAL